MPRVVIHARAGDDITRIFARIAPHDLNAALRVNHAIERAFEFLAQNPLAGARCEIDHPKAAEYRFWPVKKFTDYLVIYCPVHEGIEVVRVIHGAQDMYRVLP